MSAETLYVKVRFDDERAFRFVGADGRTTRLVLHASPFRDVEGAKACARRLVEDNDDVAEAHVRRGRRCVASYGTAMPPRPLYGAAGGYRYLIGVTGSGRGRFAVVDADGNYGTVDFAVYEALVAERDRAGLSGPMTVYGRLCFVVTDGLRFVQRWGPAPRL